MRYKAYLRVPGSTYHISFRPDGKIYAYNGGGDFLADYVTFVTDEAYLAVFGEESPIHGYCQTAEEAIDKLTRAVTLEVVAPGRDLRDYRELLIDGIEALRELKELVNDKRSLQSNP